MSALPTLRALPSVGRWFRGGRLRLLTIGVSWAAVLSTAALPAQAAAPSGTSAGAGLRVGSLTLRPCPAPPAWCGSLPVPFDRTDPSAGTISIGFLWYPAAAPGPAEGTIVAEEGGPGYPSSGTRGEYLPLFRPLLDHRNLLLVDDRGTGMSGAIRCPSLQRFQGVEPSPGFTEAVAQCGVLLDHQRRRPDGSWVHGADLYGTANAARDLADVLTALATGPVDLYGDSYGTWFSQTFASRYPSMLRSVTLDASYQVLELSPWYISTVTTSRVAFNAACRRSLACLDRGDGEAWARVAALAARLRAAPVDGTVVDNLGRPTRVHVDIQALVNVVNDAGFDIGVYAEIDAAARALLLRGDAVPLLRLTVQSLEFDNAGFGGPTAFSDGLYMAVACTDYPQLFDMHAQPAQRRVEFAERTADLPADTFSPFTTREWLLLDQYDEAYNACLDWPAPVHRDPPIVKAPPLVPATIPVLVLGGDLDTLTPIDHGGRVVARQMGPSARLVIVPNTTHVTALLDAHDCASDLVQQFMLAPSDLAGLDTSCTQSVPEVRAVGAFPESLRDAAAAEALPGNGAGGIGLRAATVATETAGDAIYRWGYLAVGVGTGLRGGTFTNSGSGRAVVIRLDGSRWVTDAAASGTVAWDRSTGVVSATVRLTTASAGSGTFTISWDGALVHANATVRGSFDGRTVLAVLPAP